MAQTPDVEVKIRVDLSPMIRAFEQARDAIDRCIEELKKVQTGD
jgi:hypothetical protein